MVFNKHSKKGVNPDVLDMPTFTIASKTVLRALKEISRSVATRASMPILTYVKIQAQGNRVTFSSTNLESWSQEEADATRIRHEGSVCLPYRDLLKLFTYLPPMDVVFRPCPKGEHQMHVIYGESAMFYPVHDADEFPLSPSTDNPATYAVDAKKFASAIRVVMPSASHDETRIILTGVLFEARRDRIKLITTDTHRLAWSEFEPETTGVTGPGFNAIIPALVIADIPRKLAYADGAARLDFWSLSADHDGYFKLSFRRVDNSMATLTVRQIGGQFPNWERVVPSVWKVTATVSRMEMLAAARRASIVTSENANRLMIDSEASGTGGNPSKLIMSAFSGGGMIGIRESVVAAHDFPVHIESAINAKYLIEMLNVFTSQNILIHHSESLRPWVIEQDEPNPSSGIVLMPMQRVDDTVLPPIDANYNQTDKQPK